MIFKDVSLTSPLDQIIYDDVLLQCCEKGLLPECFRLWESPSVSIVLGRVGRPEEELWLEQVVADRVSVFRRSSGGGTVVQGPGCLNFTFVLSKSNDPRIADLRASYQAILGPVIHLLASAGVAACFCPISDLAFEGTLRKFSGNAQRRARGFILHHGTLLYGMDLKLCQRYLKMPAQAPEYRKGRDHSDFIANLPLTAQQLRQSFLTHYVFDKVEHDLHPVERGMLQEERQKDKWVVYNGLAQHDN
ncbi:MAG TPA: lipoate--protein ligase family protein [Candidatus Omnitrophota bacterium]|nr:lipoate--protein ligase family protein [Candidatus Omnitrophota bacterium]HSA30903.1 lipoate--protein ligase family protein [Candidatus Omnitrophota bacterium]